MPRRMRADNYRYGNLCIQPYYDMAFPYIHSYGLTDAILARTDAKADWPGHKFALGDRAKDLSVLLEKSARVDAGVYRTAVEAGRAPDWIVDNLESIEVVARKIYNRHHLGENLRLAFTFPERIRVSSSSP